MSVMMRQFAVGLAVLFITTAVYGESISENLDVFIFDIEEHKVLISSPHDYGDTQHEVDDLYDYADWACEFYNRVAVGPLSYIEAESGCLESIESLQYYDTDVQDYFRDHQCAVIHLFACAVP